MPRKPAPLFKVTDGTRAQDYFAPDDEPAPVSPPRTAAEPTEEASRPLTPPREGSGHLVARWLRGKAFPLWPELASLSAADDLVQWLAKQGFRIVDVTVTQDGSSSSDAGLLPDREQVRRDP